MVFGPDSFSALLKRSTSLTTCQHLTGKPRQKTRDEGGGMRDDEDAFLHPPSLRPRPLLYPCRMLRKLLAGLWRGAPRFVRRAGVWVVQPRFTVTAGAGVCDEGGGGLLLRHVLRRGGGWGVPGGLLRAGARPAERVRLA